MPRVFILCFLALSTITAVVAQQAQTGGQAGQTAGQTGGDQFLDGIGETSLIARYVFNGNTEDSSRMDSAACCFSPATAATCSCRRTP